MIIKIIMFKIYVAYIIVKYAYRKFFFGTEYANKLFYNLNRHAVVHLLRFNKASIGRNTLIDSPLIIHYKNDDLSKLNIGDNCRISKNCFLDLAENITIHNNCTLAMNVTIITHTDKGESNLGDSLQNSKEGVIVNQGTYIGANVLILQGTTVGKNCLIAAKSLVNKNVSDNSKVLGVPAKKIK
ncbi:acyltransferase [Flavobacteriaceae bacterium 14752]|uniref:acyltransferase n=1 Tax=Mesohalobacter salilacus TaxID=2491711 RepID=UPI000F6360C7|nr:acyltransferase [Flavobacteriaceae bacterium 14752]